MLVIAVVTVNVLAIVAAVVLPTLSSTPNSQAAYESKRTTDINAERSLEGALAVMRTDVAAGGVTGTGGCNNPNSDAQLSSDGTITVTCTPTPTSQLPGPWSGMPPDAVIETLGGVSSTGNSTLINSTYSTSTLPNAAIPFCDDYHNPGGSCEAGLYIGKHIENSTTSTITDGGGLLVASNGNPIFDCVANPATCQPLVASNSSIIVKHTTNGTARFLRVSGKVFARRFCDPWVSVADKTFNPTSPFYTSWSNSSTLGLCNQNQSLLADPMIPHEAIGFNTGTSAVTDYAGVDTNPFWAHNADAGLDTFYPSYQYGTNPPGHLPGTIGPLGSQTVDPQTACTRDPNGPGIVTFKPGLYDDAADLTTLMHDNTFCRDALFWFMPGTYYFEFDRDINGNPAPFTDPIFTEHTSGQIVAGTPLGWTPQNAAQTGKLLATNVVDMGNTTSNWATDQAYDALNIGDNAWGHVDLAKSDGTLFHAQIQEQGTGSPSVLQTGLPGTANGFFTSLDNLRMEITYRTSTTGINTTTDPMTIQAKIPGIATCTFNLQPDTATLSHARETTDANEVTHPTSPGTVFDIRTCNGGTTTTGWPTLDNGPNSWNRHPEWVNELNGTVYAAAIGAGTKTTPVPWVEIDGIQFIADYHGRPAPNYPHGCDNSGNNPGVQFIVGGNSRIDLENNGSNSFFELCASRLGQRVDSSITSAYPNGTNDAIGIYGMSESAAPLPFTMNATKPLVNSQAWPTQVTDWTTSTWRTTLFDQGTCSTNCADASGTCTVATCGVAKYAAINDGADGCTPVWNNGNQVADVGFVLPNNLVPIGSEILRVKVQVRHREGAVAAGFNPTACGNMVLPRPTSTVDPIQGVSLRIQPGTAGVGSSGSTASTWTTGSGNVPLGKIDNCESNTYCTWTWGTTNQALSAPRVYPDPINPDLAAQWGSTPAPDWGENQRSLTDALSTAEAINGAQIAYQVNAASGPNSQAWLDGIAVTVKYRPPTQMRPLTGCNTIRSRYIPSGTEADGSHAPDGNEATPTPSSATGPGVLSGVDWDWWPQPALDQPYGDASGAGNDLRGDANDCAMLTVAKGVKFHIDGMIYAPTGAIDLSGNDNDASWATDGIIVRHFTAFRWSNTGDNLPAVGGIDMRPTKRTFKLEVHQGGATGLVLASEWVTIDDGTGGPQVGQSVTVKCFAFRSTNCN